MADGSTTTYSLKLPEVGASQNTWGGKVNDNFDDIDELLDGTTAIKPNLNDTEGSEWQVGGTAITADASEINKLDGLTGDNIQTQLGNKAAKNGDSGVSFEADPPSADDSSNKVPTTSWVQTEISGMDTKANILSAVYPVGSIFTTVTAYANSAAVVAVIGGTTWVAFGAGKVLVGLDSGDSDFNTVEEEGGRKDAVTPVHSHTINYTNTTDKIYGGYDANRTFSNVSGSDTSETTSSTGDSLTGNENLQPYVVVYMWKRTD